MTPMGLVSFSWLPLDTWIVVIGALSAMSCALLGVFLVLRRMSLMGDAISHAVLPGLAVAFLLTEARDSVFMFAGAAAVGVLTALLTQWLSRAGRVDEGAAMGVIFTTLFALGLILIRVAADHVDLDPDCVLYGAIEFAPLDTMGLFGWEVPRAAVINGATLLVNGLFVLLLFKELRITSFDPSLATALGFNSSLLHYLLMTLVAITTVAAFESVGSILVIAMLIVPPATAHLLTDRLSRMVLLSLGLAAVAAGLGHLGALTAPGAFGLSGVSASTAGMMGVASGGLFVVVALVAPQHGIVSRWARRAALTRRIVCEDLLGLLYRLDEARASRSPADALGLLREATGVKGRTARAALRDAVRRGWVRAAGAAYALTEPGRSAAQQLIRSHRLWEVYLDKHLDLPRDHLHRAAEQLEHVTNPGLQRRLADSVAAPLHDPHGASIPPGGEKQ